MLVIRDRFGRTVREIPTGREGYTHVAYLGGLQGPTTHEVVPDEAPAPAPTTGGPSRIGRPHGGRWAADEDNRVPEPPPAPAVGPWLRSARRAAGLRQADVAAALDPPVKPVTVSQWETGRAIPARSRLPQLARVLGAEAPAGSGAGGGEG